MSRLAFSGQYGCHRRHVSSGCLTHEAHCCSGHCWVLTAEVIGEADGGEGSVGDSDCVGDIDGDADNDDDDGDSDDAMDEEGAETSSGSAAEGKKKIEDKVLMLRGCLPQDTCIEHGLDYSPKELCHPPSGCLKELTFW